MNFLKRAYTWLESRATDRDPVYRYLLPLCVILAFLGAIFGLSAIEAFKSPTPLP